jgi:hypothetical protein
MRVVLAKLARVSLARVRLGGEREGVRAELERVVSGHRYHFPSSPSGRPAQDFGRYSLA